MPRSIALPAGVPDPNRRARLVCLVLLVVIAGAVAWIVGQPGPPDPQGQYRLGLFLYHQHRFGLPHWINFSLVESLSNVVMFTPLGFLGALSLRRHSWLAVPALAAISGLIELSQDLFLPDRVASISDIVANSTGALIGFLVALPILRRRQRRFRAVARGRRLAGLRTPTPRQPEFAQAG